MKRITAAAAVLIVGLFLVGLFAAPASAATGSVWKVGDKWAMGAESDFGANITEKKDEINNLLKASNLTIDKLNVEGKAGYYMLYEVTGESATTYTLTAKVATKIATQIDLVVTGKLPVAGTYDVMEFPMSPNSDVPKETKTVTMDLNERMGVVASSTLIVEKGSMAITNMTWSFKSAMNIEFDATNVPDINTTDQSQIISYKNYDMGVDMSAGAEVYMDFDPYLDLYQLPVVQGETWYTNESAVTISGYVNGFINAHGLTDEQKEQIFTQELKEATGASDFPIEFNTLNTTDGTIKNGHFGPYTETIPSMKMQCSYGSITRTIGGMTHEYYWIKVDDSSKIWYSPDWSFMSGMVVDSSETNMDMAEVDMLTGIVGDQVAMEPMDPDAASKNIASIESYTDKLSSEVNSEPTSLMDYFTQAPYLGLLAVALLVASVGILVFYVVRTRKH